MVFTTNIVVFVVCVLLNANPSSAENDSVRAMIREKLVTSHTAEDESASSGMTRTEFFADQNCEGEPKLAHFLSGPVTSCQYLPGAHHVSLHLPLSLSPQLTSHTLISIMQFTLLLLLEKERFIPCRSAILSPRILIILTIQMTCVQALALSEKMELALFDKMVNPEASFNVA